MKIQHTLLAALGCLCLLTTTLHGQVPNLINYQGRVAVGSTNFNSPPAGQFKFALVNATGTVTYWRNSADTTPADGVPDSAVALTVTKGLYSVLLGDTAITNMAAIPVGDLTNPDVRLRVWFNDGINGFQLLTPDQRLAPSGYLPSGAVTAATGRRSGFGGKAGRWCGDFDKATPRRRAVWQSRRGRGGQHATRERRSERGESG